MLRIILIIAVSILHLYSSTGQEVDKPNILWITSEDNSPLLGCYGDDMANTPNLDGFASGGFLYTHAYANAPVCAPTRNSLITGVYANSGGNQHMRSEYNKSEKIEYYTKFLRESGYYCSNNFKEDFNINKSQTKGVWDELGRNAHYKNRPPGQPFFAIFNTHITHESCLHKSTPKDRLKHDPKKISLPPYLPDTPEIRHDMAQYYDKIEEMDTWVGNLLEELHESGEAENTIVFYYSDHGGVLPRTKRFVYETGTHIPFIVHIPEKFRHLWPKDQTGSKIDDLISLVDLPPTLLSIIGMDIPEYMQGQAFLGRQKEAPRDYVFMFRDRMSEKYDFMRSVRDKQFRYIRNYLPFRPYGQHREYLMRSQSYQSWKQEFDHGRCDEIQSKFWLPKPVEELYDTENDPWEVNNLADNPEYKEVLERMRTACREWMVEIKDTGFIPEYELVKRMKEKSGYDYMRTNLSGPEQYIEMADLALKSNNENKEKAKSLLSSEDNISRYWGLVNMKIMGEATQEATPLLSKALKDLSPIISITAAEYLYSLGEEDSARMILLKGLKSEDMLERMLVLNTLNVVEDDNIATKNAVLNMVLKKEKIGMDQFDVRLAKHLFEKWELSTEEYGFLIDW